MKRFNKITEMQMSKITGGGFILVGIVTVALAVIGCTAATVGQAVSSNKQQ